MELTSMADVIFNPVAQVKFVHTVSAGYVTASMFVLGVSCWYLLKRRDTAFALRSCAIAAAFGLASTLCVIVLGDESGYTTGEVQKAKLAAIESEWETSPAPASFTLFGIPNQKEQRTDYAVKIPYALGLIATRSFDGEVTGLKDIIHANEARVRSGIIAYSALQEMKSGSPTDVARAAFEKHQQDLGYALLLRPIAPRVVNATDAQIAEAALSSIPKVAPVFFSFRIMVGLGILFLLTFVLACWLSVRGKLEKPRSRWFLRWAVCAIPLPWLAAEFGWITAEMGRQPWTIAGILPTSASVSTLTPNDLYFSIGGFVLFYTVLFVVEMFLMFKYARLGPSSLHTGRYHDEPQVAR